MRMPDKRWSKSEGAQGLLFFAQQMREMLTPQTFESFRAMSLDTMARLRECRRVLSDFERGSITDATIQPFLAELEWSLDHDKVVKEHASALSELYRNRLKDKKLAPSTLSPVIDSLIKSLEPIYKDRLETAIIEVLSDTSHRSKLKTLTSFYCSHILNIGYTRAFALDAVNSTFFSRDMLRAGSATLRKFFKSFDGSQNSYRVYVLTDRRFSNPLARIHQHSLPFAALPAHVQQGFSAIPHGPTSRWLTFDADALDVYGAAELNEFMLNSVQAINHLGPQIDGYNWHNERYVTTPRSSSGQMISPPSAQSVTIRRRTSNRAKPIDLAHTLRTVLGQLDEPSTSRLLNSLNTSDLRGRHITPQTRLISLWSAVEVLLSDPPKGTARILHYEQTLLPCICLKYMRRNLAAVYGELLRTYRAKFLRIVDKEPQFADKDRHSRFAAIIMLNSNADLQRNLTELCADNPLARYRLYRLWSEISKPKAFKSAVSDHEKRVRWQIYRIYRARNTLVHAGIAPTYLQSLIQNLLEYYTSGVWTILSHVRRDAHRSGLRTAVAEIGVEYEVYNALLRDCASQSEFTQEQMFAVMHVR